MLITPDATSVLECTEASQTFSDKPLEGFGTYSDFYTMALDTASKEVLEQMAKAKAVFVLHAEPLSEADTTSAARVIAQSAQDPCP